MWRRTVLGVVILLGVLGAPALLIKATVHDMETPAGLARPISEFGSLLVHGLDMSPTTHVRYVASEWRLSDQLLILYFELRSWPYLAPPTIGYLVSRCSPIEALDTSGMGGGIVPSGEVNFDPELEYLRDIEGHGPCT